MSTPQNYKGELSTFANFIPRRSSSGSYGIDLTSGKKYSISQILAMNPGELLRNLPAIHPSVGLALWNAIRLTCPPEDSRIVCYKKNKKGLYKIPDEKALSVVNAMIDAQPCELGGLLGLRSILTAELMLTGMACVEAVPNNELNGIHRIFPVDSLSIKFLRIFRNGDCEPFQKQMLYSLSTPEKLQSDYDEINKKFGIDDKETQDKIKQMFALGYVHLNKNTFFWRSIDSAVDDPYGLSPYATAVIEVIRDLMLIQDLSDAIHNAAWPRTLIGINMQVLHETAVQVLKIRDNNKVAEWVTSRFNQMATYIQNLPPGANIAFDSAGDVKTLSPGSFSGIEPILAFLRQRIVQSLKSLPSLMGINDGGTFNFTSVEWQIYSTGLETVRRYVRELIEKVLTLHLRLSGIDAIVCIKDTAIRATDELIEANTKSVNIGNNDLLYKAGIISQEEYAMNTVHHSPDQSGPREINTNSTLKQGNSGQGKQPEKTGTTPAEQNSVPSKGK